MLIILKFEVAYFDNRLGRVRNAMLKNWLDLHAAARISLAYFRKGRFHCRTLRRQAQKVANVNRLRNPQTLPQKNIRLAKSFLLRTLPGNPSLFHHHDLLAHRHDFMQPVFHHNNRDSQLGIQFLQNLQQLHCAARIHLTDRLVQRQHLWSYRQYSGQRQPLTFAAGQCMNAALLTTGQANPLQGFRHAPADFRRVHPHIFQSKAHFVGN